LITTVNGSLKGYWYNDGYIRTSSEEYNLDDVSNRMIHLTNDAVQKHNQSYGKYEDFNKVNLHLDR
jgi:tubulin polyglutamylase TTLL1/tubulin monoglycylase TTLL3/8